MTAIQSSDLILPDLVQVDDLAVASFRAKQIHFLFPVSRKTLTAPLITNKSPSDPRRRQENTVAATIELALCGDDAISVRASRCLPCALCQALIHENTHELGGFQPILLRRLGQPA
jgi:hypothetical protein